MTVKRASFQWRAMVSVLVGFAFVVLVVTGLVLFISPPGRIANWTDWSIATLTKSEWGAVHVSFGVLFLIASLLHIVFNWRPLIGYFKNRLTRRLSFRPEWAVAVLLGVGIFAGTKADLPPFSALAALEERFKASWDEPSQRAPIPHAELLTVAELAEQGGVDLETAATRLRASKVSDFAADTVIADLAEASGLPAQRIYEIMVPPSQGHQGRGQGGGGVRGASGPGGGSGRGMGWKTLEQFCADEGISIADATARLQVKDISASRDQTLREIAVENGFDRPFELLELLRTE